jgi:hypothetical protein
MKNESIFCWIAAMMLLLASCDLSEFQMDRLAKTTELSPAFYRPVSVGTYLVKDYATVPGSGNTLITADSLMFRLIEYPLDSLKLNTTGTDSMMVVIKTINETPMKLRYSLTFNGTTLDSGYEPLSAATINTQGDVLAASRDSLEYRLSTSDVVNLGTATQMDLAIKLFQPEKGPVLANVLKNSPITFYIGFRARINLFKVKI